MDRPIEIPAIIPYKPSRLPGANFKLLNPEEIEARFRYLEAEVARLKRMRRRLWQKR